MQDFKDFLKHENLSKNTIDSYQSSVDLFFSRYEKVTKITYFPSRHFFYFKTVNSIFLLQYLRIKSLGLTNFFLRKTLADFDVAGGNEEGR